MHFDIIFSYIFLLPFLLYAFFLWDGCQHTLCVDRKSKRGDATKTIKAVTKPFEFRCEALTGHSSIEGTRKTLTVQNIKKEVAVNAIFTLLDENDAQRVYEPQVQLHSTLNITSSGVVSRIELRDATGMAITRVLGDAGGVYSGLSLHLMDELDHELSVDKYVGCLTFSWTKPNEVEEHLELLRTGVLPPILVSEQVTEKTETFWIQCDSKQKSGPCQHTFEVVGRPLAPVSLTGTFAADQQLCGLATLPQEGLKVWSLRYFEGSFCTIYP